MPVQQISLELATRSQVTIFLEILAMTLTEFFILRINL